MCSFLLCAQSQALFGHRTGKHICLEQTPSLLHALTVHIEANLLMCQQYFAARFDAPASCPCLALLLQAASHALFDRPVSLDSWHTQVPLVEQKVKLFGQVASTEAPHCGSNTHQPNPLLIKY